MCSHLSMLLLPKNIEEVSKSILDKADKQIRVGITRTDIDSIWAELYEKGITQPSTEQLVESVGCHKKEVFVCKRKVWGTYDFYGS